MSRGEADRRFFPPRIVCEVKALAGPVLDRYHRIWNDQPLDPHEFVNSADEKTQL